MTRIKSFILLLLVAILSLIFFLTILFPEKTVRNYLANTIASKGFVLAHADRIKLSFLPPGINITALKIETPQGTTVLDADTTQVTPTIDRTVHFRVMGCDGTIDGQISLQNTSPRNFALNVADFSLEKCPGANIFSTVSVKGAVNTDIDVHFSTSGKIIKGRGKVSLRRGEVTLPTLSQPLSIDESFMHFSIETDTLRIQKGSLQNQYLKGDFEGTISLADHATDLTAEILVTNPATLPSHLPLNTMQPTHLTITGPMEKPAIHIR